MGDGLYDVVRDRTGGLLVSVNARLGGAGPFAEGWGRERGIGRPAGVLFRRKPVEAFVSETGSGAGPGRSHRERGHHDDEAGVGRTA